MRRRMPARLTAGRNLQFGQRYIAAGAWSGRLGHPLIGRLPVQVHRAVVGQWCGQIRCSWQGSDGGPIITESNHGRPERKGGGVAETVTFLRANPAWIALFICIISCIGCVMWSARRELAGLPNIEGQMWFHRFFILAWVSIGAIIVTGVRS